MLLVRLCHVAQMPDPDALLKQLQGTGGGTPNAPTSGSIGGHEQTPPATENGPAAAANAAAPPSNTMGTDTQTAMAETAATVAVPSAAVSDHSPMPDPSVNTNLAPAPSLYDPDDLDSNFIDADASQSNAAKPGWQVTAPQAQMPVPESYAALVEMLEGTRQGLLATHMSEDVRPVSLNGTSLRIRLTDRAPRDLARTLAMTLQTLTGENWDVGLSDEDGEPTLGEQRRMARAEEYRAAQSHPAVAKALATFPRSVFTTFGKKSPMATLA